MSPLPVLAVVISAFALLSTPAHSLGPAVVLYSAGNFAGGSIGSRTSANGLCNTGTATTAQCGGSQVAFIAYLGDTLVNFPTAHSISAALPVKDQNGVWLAKNYASLFVRNGTIPYVQYSSAFWTGSTLDGTAVSFGAANCGAWSSLTSAGTVGSLASPSIAIGNDVSYVQGCSLTYQLLCVCNGQV